MKKRLPTDGKQPLRRQDYEIFAQLISVGTPTRDAFLAINPRAAGYKHRQSVATCACRIRNTPAVKARIRYLFEKSAASMIAQKVEVARTLTEILRCRHSDFLTMSADGVWHHDIGPETLNQAGLKRVRTRTTGSETGDGVIQFDEIELESKVPAAKTLSDLMGYNAKQQVEHSGAITVRHGMPMPGEDDDDDDANEHDD